MRILVILTLIVGGIAFAAFKLLGNNPVDQSQEVAKIKAVGSGGFGPPVPSPKSGGDPESFGQQGKKPVLVESSANYRFENRDVPPPEWFAAWNAAGVSAVADPLTRVVSCWGLRDGVEAMRAALVSLDLLQGSCALYSWCVYVDESQQKGWDLVAAIREVASEGFGVIAAPGGLTFSLSNERLSAVLAVVCDGATVEVVQRPYLRLTHGQPAIVEAISEIPLPSSTVSNGVAQSSIVYRKVGLQMTVKPRFLPDERVVLDVEQTNGIVGPYVDVAGSKVPQVDTQRVATAVELAIGDAAVLGGVRTSRVRHSRGLFRDKEEISSGYMYVIVSTSSEVPRAVRPGEPVQRDPFHGMLDGVILPPLEGVAPFDSPGVLPPP